jgi:hypothetical protein
MTDRAAKKSRERSARQAIETSQEKDRLIAELKKTLEENQKTLDEAAQERVRIKGKLQQQSGMLEAAVKEAMSEKAEAAKVKAEAEASVVASHVLLTEAVDIAHRLIARIWSAFPYWGDKSGDFFVKCRRFLDKHGRIESTDG